MSELNHFIIYGVYIIPEHCGHKVYILYTKTKELAKEYVEKLKVDHEFLGYHELGVRTD